MKPLRIHHLPDNLGVVDVSPEKGQRTLYVWKKGNDTDGWWHKADYYDATGELTISGMLGDSLQEIIDDLAELIASGEYE